jgi:hypothetical protein
MQNADLAIHQNLRRTSWNKGKLLGPKPPLQTKHVCSIRTTVQVDGRIRDLAMFNLAIASEPCFPIAMDECPLEMPLFAM